MDGRTNGWVIGELKKRNYHTFGKHFNKLIEMVKKMFKICVINGDENIAKNVRRAWFWNNIGNYYNRTPL